MGIGCENLMKFCALLVVFAVLIYGSTAEALENGTVLPTNVTFSTFSEGRNDSSRNTTTAVEVSKQNGYGRGGGGGGYRWGWGWGWGGGGGGGGGGWWKWGCGGQTKSGRGGGGRMGRNNRVFRERIYDKEDYKRGEFGQCMVRGRCRGMRLDCPLHCGGPCIYDCRYMCKAHCRRP